MERQLNTTNSKGRRTISRPLSRIRFEREIIAGGSFTRAPRFSHVKPNSILVGHVAGGEHLGQRTYVAVVLNTKGGRRSFHGYSTCSLGSKVKVGPGIPSRHGFSAVSSPGAAKAFPEKPVDRKFAFFIRLSWPPSG